MKLFDLDADAFMVQAERTFVNQFIKKNRRQRLLYELSGRNRQNGLGRFCHNAEDMFVTCKVIDNRKDISVSELQSMLPAKYKDTKCYIMAYNESIDRQVCDYNKALEMVLGNGMAAIIVFDGFAVVETEQYSGSAQKLVLMV